MEWWNRRTEGVWYWNTAEKFFLPFPLCQFRSIFGKGLVVDGYFELSGKRASRRKKRSLSFRERVPNRLFSKVHKDMDLEVIWDEKFIYAPCSGATLWAAYAIVIEWGGDSGRRKKA